MFEIIEKDKKTKARIGVLRTKKGKVETPFFMPVSTKMTPKYINSMKLNEMGIKAVISNAFILSMRPGSDFVKKMGGIGKLMNFNGVNFMDSGGFQMYSKSIYVNSNDRGVYFRNPFSGEKIFMTPEENMKIQIELEGDVAMCLDSMPMYEESKEDIEEAVRKTVLWARRCKKEHDKLQEKVSEEKRQLLFGITQGGKYEDLREKCTKELLELDFDGYSIGGFGLGESREEEYKIIELSKKLIPESMPIYLMGIGDPIEILEAISRGCDIFDSRLPTQNARRGSLFTSEGKLRILRKEYEFDKGPIDKNCKCFACKNYTRAYIRYLLREKEAVGKELASYHNIYYLNDLIETGKDAIRKGKFREYVESVKKKYKKKNKSKNSIQVFGP